MDEAPPATRNGERARRCRNGLNKGGVQRRGISALNRRHRLNLLSKNILRLLLACGCSEEALAFESGLHRTFIAHVERQLSNISLDNIEKMATALESRSRSYFYRKLLSTFHLTIPSRAHTRLATSLTFEGVTAAIGALSPRRCWRRCLSTSETSRCSRSQPG